MDNIIFEFTSAYPYIPYSDGLLEIYEIHKI